VLDELGRDVNRDATGHIRRAARIRAAMHALADHEAFIAHFAVLRRPIQHCPFKG